jgi:hypothetical protein
MTYVVCPSCHSVSGPVGVGNQDVYGAGLSRLGCKHAVTPQNIAKPANPLVCNEMQFNTKVAFRLQVGCASAPGWTHNLFTENSK